MTIYTISHPIDGELDFSSDGESVRAKARWPFDLQTDEWIFLSVIVPLEDLKSAIDQSLTAHEKAWSESSSEDRLTITPIGEDFNLNLSTESLTNASLTVTAKRRDILGLRAALNQEKAAQE